MSTAAHDANHLVIVGLGYVGLPLAQAASEVGVRVTGLDLSSEVVDGLNRGISHVDDICDEDVRRMIEAGFRASTDPTVVQGADVVVICVPTPLTLEGAPDLSAVEGAVSSIARNLKPDTLVVLESTTFPGTTETIVLPLLEKGSGRVVGIDLYLAFSPERVDPGNKLYTIRNTPKVVGGVTAACAKRAGAFYETFVDEVVLAKGTREAETAKLLENTYRHINIALVNEMARVCHAMKIDVWDVIRCASSKPFGFHAFYPGPGVGGHCIPIDPNYLSYAVKSSLGYPFRFVELAQEINKTMPMYVHRRIQDLLNQDGVALNGARILLVGITYKPNIADQRESPADDLFELLHESSARVSFYDPMIAMWNPKKLGSVPKLESFEAAEFDACVVLQHHDSLEPADLLPVSRRILDTRGSMTGDNVEWL